MRIWPHSLCDYQATRNPKCLGRDGSSDRASMEERIVSPSMALQRLGSYARQNSVYQTLSEIGRVQKQSTF